MNRNFNRRGLRNFADTPIDRLCLAVEHGDLRQVEELLDRGVDPNGRNSRGMTPLVLASYYGYVDIAKALIDAGASVVRYVNGTTAIAQSIGVSLEMLQLLIDSGADVNAKADAIYGKTPLHQAVEYGLPDYAQVLLDAGADIEAKDNDGWTPLMTAVAECKRDMVKFLVEHGANINTRSPDFGTALDLAIKDGISDIVSYLRNAQSPKQKMGKMSILDKKLLKSLVGKKPADIAGLLEAGANPNAVDDAGVSALLIAVSWDRFEDVKLLVEAGANINEESGNDVWSGTPLARSIMKNNIAITKYLIDEGADVNQMDSWGDTALIDASDKPVFTRLLLDAGADPNIGEVYHNKKTALLYATDHGNLAVVKMLVEAGADLEHRDEHGKTALDIAIEGDHTKIAAYLRGVMNERGNRRRPNRFY